MPDIRIFDSCLNSSLSTYDADHLNVLEKVEQHHFWFQYRREKICQIFQKYVHKNARILEVGGGTGFIAQKLINLGFSIEMGDIHLNGLQYAGQKGISKLYQFDLFQPPFQEEFDLICLFDVLEHLSDDRQALLSLKKMVRPGGLMIFTVPAHMWLWSREDVIAGHKRRYTKKKLEQLFHASNLAPLHISYFFSAILPFLYLRKWLHKDDASVLKAEEKFEAKLAPFLNKFCSALTKTEFFLEPLLPNLAGGSLLGIVKKIN